MIYNAGLEEYNDYDRNIIRIKLQPFRKIEIPKADVPEKRALSIDVLRAFFNGKILNKIESIITGVKQRYSRNGLLLSRYEYC